MEITTMQMYWLVMLDNLIGNLIAILVMCVLFFILGCPMFGMMGKGDLAFTIMKKLLVVVAVNILLLTFIPSTKSMAAILIVPKIANNEKVQTIGNKVYDLAVEWMNELKPSKKEGAK